MAPRRQEAELPHGRRARARPTSTTRAGSPTTRSRSSTTAPRRRRTRSRARSTSRSTSSTARSSCSAATCARRRCCRAARATTRCWATATRSSAGAKRRTSPSSTPPGRWSSTRTCRRPAQVYRAFRFPWSATPAAPPAIALKATGAATTTVYASWNGATGVAAWRVLGGATPASLTALATVAVERLRDGDRAAERGAGVRRAGARRRPAKLLGISRDAR